MMAFSVKGKNAVVTGGASGINLAFAKLLATKGANVLVADVQETEDLQKAMKESWPGKLLYKKTDITDWKQLDELFEYAKSKFGSVDLMCNGAGVFEPAWSSFWNDTETSSYKSIDINLTALLRGTRLAIRDQIARSKGRPSTDTVGVILNITSLAAQFALFNQPLYCSSKAAVSAFTRALGPLHSEYGIKVVAVAPGMVWTPLWTNNPDKMKALSSDDVGLTPEELAEAMLLAAESEQYPGGTVLEKLKNTTRIVKIDSEPPSGPASTMSNMGLIYNDTIELLERERTGSR